MFPKEEMADRVASLDNQDVLMDDYSQDNFVESLNAVQTHDDMTPPRNFSSSLMSSPERASPMSTKGHPILKQDEGRNSPVLGIPEQGKEPLLKGLKLHKIPLPG